MPAAVESMFSAREVPWHGLGTITDDVLTAADAIAEAGLNWTVSKRPVYFPTADKKSKIKVPDQYAIVRDSDDRYLGRVGKVYNPLQNVDAFGFIDNLVDSGEAKYETAGSLRGGRTIFLTMKVGEDLLVAGEDRHELYIMLRNTHDGSSKVGVFLTPIRAVCMNTVTMGIASAQQRWEVAHTSKLEGRLQEARETLQLTQAYAEEFVKMGDALVNTKVTDAELRSILETAIPARPTIDEVIDGILGMYHDSPTNGYTGNGWGAFNAVTEYYDHVKEVRKPEARFASIMDGYIAGIRNKTAELLLSK